MVLNILSLPCYSSIHHTSNVRLRAPSMDSEFIDSDREDLNSSRSTTLQHTFDSSDNNNQRDKLRFISTHQTPDSARYLEEDTANASIDSSPIHIQQEVSEMQHPSSEWVTSPAVSATVIMPQVKPGMMFPRCLSDGVEKFRDENRRLLPKCQNRLHIIDGKEYRYFLGVVDFLTRFDWRQKMAQYWKIVKYRCGDHSTKSPDVYRRRFVDFLHSKVR